MNMVTDMFADAKKEGNTWFFLYVNFLVVFPSLIRCVIVDGEMETAG